MIVGIRSCCRVSCCSSQSIHPTVLTQYKNDSSGGLLNTDILPEDEDLRDRFYEQASFWVIFLILLLIMGIVTRSVYYTIKPNRVLELLKRMSTGPLSETREGKGGNIEPVLFYYEPSQTGRDSSLKNKNSLKLRTKRAKKWFQHKITDNEVYEINDETNLARADQSEQILDARKLLSRQLSRLERSSDEANNLNQPTEEGGPASSELEMGICCDDCGGGGEADRWTVGQTTKQTSRRPSGTYSLSIEIPGPLPPSYQANMIVNSVWNSDINMQRLYRYTTIQGMIYPPGYVP